MRRSFLALAIVAMSFQSIGEAVGQHPGCRCHDCVQKGKGGAPEDALRPEDAPQPEAGAYVGPPRTGTQVGESNSLGIEGLSIKFPELNLKLPELNLPHLTHRRKGPRMEVEAAQAPYVSQVDRTEYGVETEAAARPEAAPRQEPEDAQRPEDAVQAPKFDRPLQRPEQKSSQYQQPYDATQSSQAVLEQIHRFEERERALTAQLEQMQQLMVRLTESAAAQGTEESHIGNPVNSSQRRQPQPLPDISMTRPASFDAPLNAIDRVPVPGATIDDSHTRQLEEQIAELRRLVLAMQQQEILNRPTTYGSSNGFQMTRVAVPNATKHAAPSPNQASHLRRLPPVVR